MKPKRNNSQCYAFSLLREKDKIDFAWWFDFFIEFAAQSGFPLSHGGLSYPKSNGKLTRTPSVEKKIRTLDPESITGMHLLLASDKEYINECPVMDVELDHSESHGNMLSVAFDQKITEGIHTDFFKDILMRSINEFNPDYGYVFERDQFRGPTFYAGGGIYHATRRHEPSEQESECIMNWMHGRKKVYTGKLRDVFEINIINERCLKQTIHAQTLGDWISTSPKNGTLKEIKKGLFSWAVERSEIERIHQALLSILIAVP